MLICNDDDQIRSVMSKHRAKLSGKLKTAVPVAYGSLIKEGAVPERDGLLIIAGVLQSLFVVDIDRICYAKYISCWLMINVTPSC